VPTPIGHSLTTLGVTELSGMNKIKGVVFLLIVGVFPDIDLLLDKISYLKNIGFYHQGITHTFLAAVIFSLFVFLFSRDMKLSLLSLVVYSLHVFLDLFMIDTHPPIGFRPFWPFYTALINIPVLPGVDKSSLHSILTFKTVRTICWETSFFSYIYITILGVKIWTGKKD